VIGAQKDEGEALVVAQQDVEGRAIPLDQLRFQKQRLGLRIGDHDLHRAALADHPLEPVREPFDLRVIRHPRLQAARLADIQDIAARIEHAIDAGARFQCLHRVANDPHARLQIGLRARDRVGRAFFVETPAASGIVGRTGFRSRHDVGDSARARFSQTLVRARERLSNTLFHAIRRRWTSFPPAMLPHRRA
jgi:hypothetical protein